MARSRLEGAGVTLGGSSGLTQELLLQTQPQAPAPVFPGPGCEPQHLSLWATFLGNWEDGDAESGHPRTEAGVWNGNEFRWCLQDIQVANSQVYPSLAAALIFCLTFSHGPPTFPR